MIVRGLGTLRPTRFRVAAMLDGCEGRGKRTMRVCEGHLTTLIRVRAQTVACCARTPPCPQDGLRGGVVFCARGGPGSVCGYGVSTWVREGGGAS